jgi:hypothetical protein
MRPLLDRAAGVLRSTDIVFDVRSAWVAASYSESTHSQQIAALGNFDAR